MLSVTYEKITWFSRDYTVSIRYGENPSNGPLFLKFKFLKITNNRFLYFHLTFSFIFVWKLNEKLSKFV